MLIDLVQSFHCDMKARVKVDKTLLQKTEVNDPNIIFNLYACFVGWKG